MKKKKLLVLAITAIVLIIIAYLVNAPGNNGFAPVDQAPERLLPSSFDSAAIAQVTIQSQDQIITLKKGDHGWTLGERYGYPINFTTLSDLFFQIQDGKVARSLILSDTQKKELRLTPDSGAITLKFLSETGDVLNQFVFGALHQDQNQPANPMMARFGNQNNGRYLLVNDNQPVLVADTFTAVDQPPSEWLNKDFFKVGDLKNAKLEQAGKTIWEAKRKTSTEDLKLQGEVPADKEVNTEALSALKSAFSWFNFTDVANPKATPQELGMDQAKTVTFMDFDGFTYVIVFGRQINGKQFLKLQSVAWNGPAKRTPGKDEKPEQTAKLNADFQKKMAENQAKAKKLTESIVPWTYEVGTYALSSIDKSFEQFLKDKPKPESKKDEKKNDATASAPKAN